MNLLITGQPGVGKTTLIQRVVAEVGRSCQGFYTQEIRSRSGGRVGFEIVTLDGRRALLAHVDRRTPQRVGRYFVQLENIDHVIVPCLEAAIASAELIVIDEIGKMELFSVQFQQVVLRALEAPQPVLGSITLADLPFVRRVKSRADVQLIALRPDNRELVYQEILKRLMNN
ncbi:MAG: NTPase [candidate division KSB1 bacterium]|nr:NTPase [candidate division KSB1 bacterium]MDZ7401586.1 NTPase [candidate division KSB1 bacterium]